MMAERSHVVRTGTSRGGVYPVTLVDRAAIEAQL